MGYWNSQTNGLVPFDGEYYNSADRSDGSIYVSGHDHVSNSMRYRLDPPSGDVDWVGDARTASTAAENWKAGESPTRAHQPDGPQRSFVTRGASHMTATDLSTTASSRTEPGRGRRWTRFRAAAPAMAIVGSVALLACDGGSSGMDASTGTTLVAAETGEAEQFIRSFNERDLVAMEAVSTDGFTFNSEVTGGVLQPGELPSLMAWYDAFDWRWEDATCETPSPGDGIRCELLERNHLTDLTGAKRPATVSFTMTAGKVESVNVDADLSDYSPNAFAPFRNWVRVNHPDDLTRMWAGYRPALSAESATLFEQHLSEYAAHLPTTTEE